MLLWVYRIWRSDTQIYRNPCTKTCLFPALFFCKECVMWVSAHCGFHLPPQRHPFAVNLVMFSANSILFLRINKPILKGWLQPNFRKRRKKKRCGGVKFLDALQLIKVSCFSLRDSWTACSLVSTKTRTPLVIHRQEIHPDANRQMCVCPCVFWCVR